MVCCGCFAFASDVQEMEEDGANPKRKQQADPGRRNNGPPTDENQQRRADEPQNGVAMAVGGNNREQRQVADGEVHQPVNDFCRSYVLHRFSNLRSSKQIETTGGAVLFELSDTSFIVRLRQSIDPVVSMAGPGLPATPQVELASAVRGPRDWITTMAMAPTALANISRTIGRCIDSVLYPVIEHGVDAPRRAAESRGETLSIHDYIASCQAAISEVCVGQITKRRRNSVNYSPQVTVSVCVSAGLLALGWISGVVCTDALQNDAAKVQASALQVSSVNTLMNLLTDLTPTSVKDEEAIITFLSSIGIFPGYVARRQTPSPLTPMDEGDELLNLSWLRHVPFYSLGTPVKGMLLAMHCAVRGYGQARVPVVVDRGLSSTFNRVHKDVRQLGLLPATEADVTQRTPHGSTCRALSVVPEGAANPTTAIGDPSDEDGDGLIAKPTKATRELFDTLGYEMTSSWADRYASGPITDSTPYIKLQESSSHALVTIPHTCVKRPRFPVGCRVTLTNLSSLYQHEHFRIQDTLVLTVNEVESPYETTTDKDGNEIAFIIKLKCNRISPLTADRLPFTISQPTLPLFKQERASTCAWFNCAAPEENKEEWAGKFAFAGWLVASAIATGATFPVGLPPVFFLLLKEWPNYRPTEEDLLSLGSLSKASLQSIRDMSQEDLAQVAEMQGLRPSCTYDEYIEHFCKELLVNQIQTSASACVNGFNATGLRSSVILRHTSAEELCAIVCGREDNPEADYYIRYEFRVYEDEAFDVYPHSAAFLEILWDVLDNQLDAAATGRKTHVNKRKFLKFLTGRAVLPSNHRQETFRLVLEGVDPQPRSPASTCTDAQDPPDGTQSTEVPASPPIPSSSCLPPDGLAAVYEPILATADDYKRLQHRLPRTHTCDVTLEVPNYAEAVIFAPSSPWYLLKERSPGCVITHADRLNAWHDVRGAAPTVFDSLRQQIVDTTVSKLTHAILAADVQDSPRV